MAGDRPEKRKGELSPREAAAEESRPLRKDEVTPEGLVPGTQESSGIIDTSEGSGAARQAGGEADEREESGYDQPESSAQKHS